MFLVLKTFENIWANQKTLCPQKMFLNLLGNLFASKEESFVSATMFCEVDKQKNIDKKHNICTTMCPSLSWSLRSECVVVSR